MKGLSKGRYDETFAGEDAYGGGDQAPIHRLKLYVRAVIEPEA